MPCREVPLNRAVANARHFKCMPPSFHPIRIGWKDGGIKKRYYIFIRCEQAYINNNNLPYLQTRSLLHNDHS